jgi:hypothetical protein
MSHKAIRDRNFRILGHIETTPDGQERALDSRVKTLGHYDPRRNITTDANFRTIARGNVLSALVYDAD